MRTDKEYPVADESGLSITVRESDYLAIYYCGVRLSEGDDYWIHNDYKCRGYIMVYFSDEIREKYSKNANDAYFVVDTEIHD